MDATSRASSHASTASDRLFQLASHLNLTNTDGMPVPVTHAADQTKRKPRSQMEAMPPDYADTLSRIRTL